MSVQSTASFIDGPAAGKSFNVDYTPIMLRVAVRDGACRPLNVESVVAPEEIVYAYMMRGRPGAGFWDGLGEKGRRTGGQFFHATYSLSEMQPDPAILCSGVQWPVWCDGHKAKLMNLYKATLTPEAKS